MKLAKILKTYFHFEITGYLVCGLMDKNGNIILLRLNLQQKKFSKGFGILSEPTESCLPLPLYTGVYR